MNAKINRKNQQRRLLSLETRLPEDNNLQKSKLIGTYILVLFLREKNMQRHKANILMFVYTTVLYKYMNLLGKDVHIFPVVRMGEIKYILDFITTLLL